MDLFSVVRLNKPKDVTTGVRPLREDEEPVLESTAGRTMDLILEEPEDIPPVALVATPLQSMPSASAQPSETELLSSDSSSEVGIIKLVSETEEESTGMKRKRTAAGDGAGTSKRRRHVIFGGDESSSEGLEKDASSPSAAKDTNPISPK